MIHLSISVALLTALKIVSTDDYMPMPISNIDEYDKVVNVSWYTPDKSREELVYVPKYENSFGELTDQTQISLRPSVFSNVSALLYRYSQLPQSVLLLLG